MYLPGDDCAIVGTAVWPPGQSVSLVPPGLASVLSKCRCQICLPVATSMPNRSSETPATTASSRVPCAVVTRSAMSGANRLCIARGVLSSFTFHSSFMLADVGGREDLLVSHPAGPRVVDALGEEVGRGTHVTPDNSRMAMASPTLAIRMSPGPSF